MSANAIRGIRRKKSSLAEVKIAVLGAPGVGKTALTVRFLTKRFIGEYDHQSARDINLVPMKYCAEVRTVNRYKSEVMVDGDPVIFEVLDTCPKELNEFPREEVLQWADGFLLIYSVTDRGSFQFVRELRRLIQTCRAPTSSVSNGGLFSSGGATSSGSGSSSGTPGLPVMFVANKADLSHLRQITTEEGEILAKDWEDGFCEVTVSEQVAPVAEAFHELCRDVHAVRRRSKQSLLDRMLGTKK